MWAGLWQKRCKFSETATAIAYEQHGFFEQVMAWCLWISLLGLPYCNVLKLQFVHTWGDYTFH